MGPDSESENQMILALDGQFDKFFTWLDQNIGLNNVWLALSADHGIAPISAEAAKLGMNSAISPWRRSTRASKRSSTSATHPVRSAVPHART